MKLFQKIALLVLAAIFVLSSSGIVFYQSSCLCTGEEQTSMFIRPDTCNTNIHQYVKNKKEQLCLANECHNCSNQNNTFGCEDATKFFFFKLENEATIEAKRFAKVGPVIIPVVKLKVFESIVPLFADIKEKEFNDDPPPLKTNAIDFLVDIQQLKIPLFIS